MPKIKVNNPKNIIKGTPTRYYFKLHNTGGPKGDKGDTGDTGPQGPKGDTGNAATVQVGTTTTLAVGQDATVENVGNQYAAIFNFGIPQGPQGPKGDKGDTGATGAAGPQGATGAKGDPGTNATVYVGTTTTGEPGTQASVYNSGSDSSAVLNFTIPQGATGATGPANTLSIGSVTKGADASATITGDAPNQTLNLVLPKGDTGPQGPQGVQGIQGVQGVQGVPGKDFSIYKTYASVAEMNADAANVPEGEFVMIASTTQDPDNAKLYVKNGEGSFTYLSDLSGAQGIQGPQGEQGIQGVQGIPGPQGETGPRGSVKSQYVAELPASGDDDTFYLVDRDLESHTESGEYITLETTQTAAAIQSAQIDGNATQTTYSGKNLFGFTEITAQNCTYTESNGVYTVVATGSSPSLRFTLAKPIAQGALTVSGSKLAGTGITVSLRGQSAQYIDANMGVHQLPKTVTPTADAYYLTLFSSISAGETQTINTTDLMVESGSTATSYEPYVGGTPAPNPEFPQPISVVTGENVVKVVGKNLFDIAQVNNLALGTTVVSGASYRGYSLSANAGDTFTLSRKNTTDNNRFRVAFTIDEPASGVAFYDKDGNPSTGQYIYIADTATSVTFTVPVGMSYAFIYLSNSGQTITESMQIQIEKGSTATSYQAYTEQDYAISLTGKNLFNKATSTDGYRIDSNGEPYANASYFISDYIVVQPSTTYAYSRGAAGSGMSTIAYYKSDKTFISRTMPTINSSDTSGTVTTPNDAYYARFCDVNGVLDSVQLELGSTATEYAAYSPIELAKIGTYQDRIYKEGEKWYVEKQVGKVVLDGSEAGWGLSGYVANNQYYLNVDGFPQEFKPVNKVMSDFFSVAPQNTAYNTKDIVGIGGWVGSGAQLRISFDANIVDRNLADFKSWLSTHQTTVYYALATPTVTEITNQSLIDQLEALASATLNQGVNNIFTEIATGNAMPTLELNWVEWEKYNRHNVYIWNEDIDDWQVIVS